MSLKISQENINSRELKFSIRLLVKNKKNLLQNEALKPQLIELKNFLVKFEDADWKKRSKAASEKLSKMTEEQRQMTLMSQEEKVFLLNTKN